MSKIVDDLRIARRTASFIGLTLPMLAAMESERALAPTPERRATILYDWIQRYGRSLLAIYGVEVVASGALSVGGRRYPGTDSRGRGRMFVMNHRSMLDIFVVLAFIEATIVSRADLARWPVIGLAARRVDTLFVDRSNKSSGAAVVQAMTDAMTRGRAVLVYAEGTTFTDDTVRPFRVGAFHAAQRAGAEIVPVGIAYEDVGATYGDEAFTQHLYRISSAPRTRAALEVGEAIAPMGEGDAARDAARSDAHARVQALVHRARGRLAPARQ